MSSSSTHSVTLRKEACLGGEEWAWPVVGLSCSSAVESHRIPIEVKHLRCNSDSMMRTNAHEQTFTVLKSTGQKIHDGWGGGLKQCFSRTLIGQLGSI